MSVQAAFPFLFRLIGSVAREGGKERERGRNISQRPEFRARPPKAESKEGATGKEGPPLL